MIGGVSVMYRKINSIQVVLHGLGCLSLLWMIIDRWSFVMLFISMIFFAIIPAVLELAVVCNACEKYRIIT